MPATIIHDTTDVTVDDAGTIERDAALVVERGRIGRWLMRDRRVVTLDESAIVEEAAAIARAAWQRLFEERPELPRPPGMATS